MRKRPLLVVLAVQLVLGATFLVLVVTHSLLPPDDNTPPPKTAGGRFNSTSALIFLKLQLSFGPRPAGSVASRRLAENLRNLLPHGRFQPVPGGLRNVVGTVPGRDPKRYVVVGAHYDSAALPGFLGANDGAGGTAAVIQLARQLRPREIDPTVHFVLFDGEELPRGVPESQFLEKALRGSKVAAREFSRAEAMILLDFVADKNLSIPREAQSDPALWEKLRGAARTAGVGRFFPPGTGVGLIDDHTPFRQAGIPSIDLIDWDFPCYHKRCDDLSAVSEKSLDASGEAVAALLRTLD